MEQCVLDRVGLGVANEDVALALVAARRSLSYLRELNVGHELAQIPACPFQPVDGDDAPAPLPSHEARARGVAALGRVELAVDHHSRPCVQEVYVVRARDERGYLRAGGPRPDLGYGAPPVPAPDPLHVAEALVHAERFERAPGGLAYVVVLRAVYLPREQNAPLYPVVADALQGRRA